MIKVNIYHIDNLGVQNIAVTCKLVNGIVEFNGDENLIKNLTNKGIFDFSSCTSRRLFPKDGQLFLEQLKNNFSSAYITASDIIKE